MATDLGDQQMKALRNGRWEKAFKGVPELCSSNEGDSKDPICINRKATIVIEHLIQR